MRTFLETGRLTLRPFHESDADAVLALDNDPEVMRYINGGASTTRAEVLRETMPALLRHYACLDGPAGMEGRGYWAAQDRVSGAFLGWFEFRPVRGDSCDEVELGYRLDRRAWGGGLATEGSRALIRLGFTQLGVLRVTATTMTVNERSRRVMEKAGLRYVRTFFEEWPDAIEGSELGDVEYAVTRAQWPAGRGDFD
ncbi:RimJ/RimL family protein N-acetyltransferase [Streptomyces sp. V4I23]|uniref:GNAT family N-acetyltransferase n=1 Tax=Streptomyces sp. V4I23 TaxID=3042282 RepID=UPI0027805C6C|nr:GNAT family N-acetyltransferase [Streptomyces sp. V4I23]MDQ1006499.1 RimJ/RimL family protein N-acetyltransferase [Streptomyces sp. V4I23]